MGKAEEKEDVLQLEKAASKNKSAYTATIPTYQIAGVATLVNKNADKRTEAICFFFMRVFSFNILYF